MIGPISQTAHRLGDLLRSMVVYCGSAALWLTVTGPPELSARLVLLLPLLV
jgi:hypothetical protein